MIFYTAKPISIKFLRYLGNPIGKSSKSFTSKKLILSRSLKIPVSTIYYVSGRILKIDIFCYFVNLISKTYKNFMRSTDINDYLTALFLSTYQCLTINKKIEC